MGYGFQSAVASTPEGYWHRAIILVDMNAFFAAIEQQDFPQLRGKPVVVTNGTQGTCIITSSYEARAYGVKTGMRLSEARQLCAQLVQCPARPQRYAEMSKAIMRALVDITPDIEVFSVDEAFLDVTRCQRLFGVPEKIAHLTRQKIQTVSGLPCSIGVSGDKTTAKYAAELIKPNGLTIIPPWEARERLRNVPVTELCGIGDGIGLFLARHGVYTCGEMEKLPISILSKRFGNLGRRLWYMCQGADPEPVHTVVAAPKSMGHGKVLPPYTTDVVAIKTYLQHMSEKLAARLRRHQMKAKDFFIGLSAHDIGWLGGKVSLVLPVNDGRKIYQLALQVLHDVWQGQALRQVQITALQPIWQWQQGDLFDNSGAAHDALLHVVDAINHRYGQLTMAPARLLKRSQTPDVIAPAWKPDGHRKTV